MGNQAERIVEHAGAIRDIDVSTSLHGKTITFTADQVSADIAASAAADVESVTEVIDHTQISGSEDASYLIRKVQANGGKATYIGIGASNSYGHHHSKFDIDEESIEIGIETLATMIRSV